MKRIFARLPVVVACAAALATFTPAFAGEPLDGYELMLVPDRTVLTPANPTATVTVMGGWFGEDAQFGISGFGQGSVFGSITADEPLMNLVGATYPFSDGPESGDGSTDVLLSNVTWFRNPVPGAAQMPPPYGANEFIPIGTFTFTAADFSDQRSVMLEASGSSFVIVDWNYLFGLGMWAALVDQDSLQSATASTWLIVVPTPGTAAPLLGACALLGRRRRAL